MESPVFSPHYTGMRSDAGVRSQSGVSPQVGPVIPRPAPAASKLAGVSERDRQVLEHTYHQQETTLFKSGSIIPLRESDIWVVCRGLVHISTFYPNGDEGTLAILKPTMPFGLPLTDIEPYQATAMGEVLALRLKVEEIEPNSFYIQHLEARLRQSEALLAIAGYRRVEERLWEFLQLMANGIRTTRVTITRIMGQLQAEGKIGFDPKRRIVVY
jgi:CRP-like cAMP-binding protein